MDPDMPTEMPGMNITRGMKARLRKGPKQLFRKKNKKQKHYKNKTAKPNTRLPNTPCRAAYLNNYVSAGGCLAGPGFANRS